MVEEKKEIKVEEKKAVVQAEPVVKKEPEVKPVEAPKPQAPSQAPTAVRNVAETQTDLEFYKQ